jgi:hypothetical protein
MRCCPPRRCPPRPHRPAARRAARPEETRLHALALALLHPDPLRPALAPLLLTLKFAPLFLTLKFASLCLTLKCACCRAVRGGGRLPCRPRGARLAPRVGRRAPRRRAAHLRAHKGAHKGLRLQGFAPVRGRIPRGNVRAGARNGPRVLGRTGWCSHNGSNARSGRAREGRPARCTGPECSQRRCAGQAGMLHPPAVSIGLIYVLGGPRFKALGWLFVALPVRPLPASPFRARLGTSKPETAPASGPACAQRSLGAGSS